MHLIEYWGGEQEQTFHSVLLSWAYTTLHNHLTLSVNRKETWFWLNHSRVQLIQVFCVRKSTKYLSWFWLLCYGIYLIHLLHSQGFPAVVCTKLVYHMCFYFCTTLFLLPEQSQSSVVSVTMQCKCYINRQISQIQLNEILETCS